MEPIYPIFVVATDDLFVQMHTSEESLNCYEKVDIAAGLYKGWDSQGHQLELVWDSKHRRPGVRVSDERERLAELRKAILNYATRYGPTSAFQATGTEESVVLLFEAVERHLKSFK